MSRLNIVNVGYDSTNYYVVGGDSTLLVDVGFPGTLPKLQHQCKRMGISLTNIKHLLCTHFHPDHAGLAQELKRLGIKLIVLENQLFAISMLRALMRPQDNYLAIERDGNVVVKINESRAFLTKLGIQGEIISTPGHSDDSICLILDQGIAFTGDLPHPLIVSEETMNVVNESWQRIRALNVRTIYPGHGPTWSLAQFFPAETG